MKDKSADATDCAPLAPFTWTPERGEAAMLLAQGHLNKEVAEQVGVSLRTIVYWKSATEFSAEVDRLSLMVGIAGRAERLRLAQRIARQRTMSGIIESDKDLLEWLKFAQSETDGAKLDLTALLAAATSVAEGRPARTSSEEPEYIN